MVDYERSEAAARAGVTVDQVSRMVELRILKPGQGDRFTPGDVRRAELVQSIEGAGVALEGLGAPPLSRTLDLASWTPRSTSFSLLSTVTFQQLPTDGVAINLLTGSARSQAPPCRTLTIRFARESGGRRLRRSPDQGGVQAGRL